MGGRPGRIATVAGRWLVAAGALAVVAAAHTPVEVLAAPVALQVPCSGPGGGAAGLAAALRSANAAGGGTVTAAAGCTYTLAAADNTTLGPTGLPVVTAPVTLTGSGTTITRSASAGTPAFRILEVASGAALGVDGMTISNGSSPGAGGAPGSGGGILNDGGTLTVTRSLVSGNSAATGGGHDGEGGGIYNLGTLTLSRSTVSGNSIPGGGAVGGGIINRPGSTVTIDTSTLSGNSAAQGAGIENEGTVRITASTLAGETGADILNEGATTVTSSILAVCAGAVTSGGHNLESAGGCGLHGPGDLQQTDPLLNPLQDNGGATPTRMPRPGSPALRTVPPSQCPAADQRGVRRPGVAGAACDIGAVEVVGTTATLSTAPEAAAAGQRLALTATVTPSQPAPDPPRGTVGFTDAGQSIGSAVLDGASPDTATLTLPGGLPAGAHRLGATYAGDPRGDYAGSSVASPATVVLVPPGSPAASPTASPPPSPGGATATATGAAANALAPPSTATPAAAGDAARSPTTTGHASGAVAHRARTTGAPPPRSAVVTALRGPTRTSLALPLVAANTLLAVAAVLLIALPGELLDSTLEEHYDEIAGRLPVVATLARRVGGAVAGIPDQVLIAGFILACAALNSLLDPHLGLNRASLALYLGLVAALAVVTLGFDLPGVLHLHARHGEAAYLRALPAALPLAAMCVLVSRLAHFEPGYVYGLVAGYAFRRPLPASLEGRAIAISSSVVLAISVVAWVVWTPLDRAAQTPGAGFGILVLNAMVTMIVVTGITSTCFGMLPLRFLPGEKVLAWSRPAWALLLGAGCFGLFHVLLNPGGPSATRTPVVTVLVLLAGFAVFSVAFWGYFRWRGGGGHGHRVETA